MAVPSYEEFIGPLLHFLGKQSQPVRARDASKAVADKVGLTDDDRAELLPSKTQLVYKNQIGWAQDALFCRFFLLSLYYQQLFPGNNHAQGIESKKRPRRYNNHNVFSKLHKLLVMRKLLEKLYECK